MAMDYLNYYGSLFGRRKNRKAAMLFFAVDLSHRVCDLIIFSTHCGEHLCAAPKRSDLGAGASSDHP